MIKSQDLLVRILRLKCTQYWQWREQNNVSNTNAILAISLELPYGSYSYLVFLSIKYKNSVHVRHVFLRRNILVLEW